MADIFDNTILCKKCNKAMKPTLVSKNGFNLRALKCPKCNEMLIHPEDKIEYENFMRLKEKDYNVKMRMVGNSYTVSIPREIVDFMKEQEKRLNEMVRLNFEEAGRLSLNFNSPEENSPVKRRAISSKEMKIVKNGKVYHVKQFSDSANPKNNKKIVYRNDMEDEYDSG